MTEENKANVDWEAIEKEYRAGIRSVRDIGAEHGVSHVGINKRAKREGWVRNLAAKIRAKAESLVTRDVVTSSVTMETEREIIGGNENMQANVIRTNRKDITRYRSLCEKLLQEIELQTGEILTFEQLGELMYAPNDKGVDKRNELYVKTISTASRIDSVKKMVDTLKTLIGLERQAFGLSDSAEGEKPKENEVQETPVTMSRMADLLQKSADLRKKANTEV